jgi:tetratricopeptide (TPR) repeat protein
VPFCRECGKNVQATWKVCPHCAAPQGMENSTQSTDVSLSDSVIGGDVTINQNNPEEIAAAMVSALERLGFSGQGQPGSLGETQQDEIKEILKFSDSLEQQGIRLSSEIELDLGRAALIVSNYDSARRHFTQALEVATQTNNYRDIVYSCSNLHNISVERGEVEDALNWAKACIEPAHSSGDMDMICDAMINVGRGQQGVGDHGGAEGTFLQVLNLVRQQNSQYQIAIVQGNLAELWRKMNKLDLASQAAVESAQILNQIGSPLEKCRGMFQCAMVNKLTEHFDLCVNQLREALQHAVSCGSKLMEKYCWMELGNVYRMHYELHDEANEYYRNYVSIRRELGLPDDQWIIDNGF